MPDHKTVDWDILSSAAYTVGTGYSSSYPVESFAELNAYAIVTTVPGGATLTLTLQDSPDNSNWADHTAFTTISATGTFSLKDVAGDPGIKRLGKYMRLKYVVAGSAVTFSAQGTLKT